MRSSFRRECEAWCRKGGFTPEELEQSIWDAQNGNVTELDLSVYRKGSRFVVG